MLWIVWFSSSVLNKWQEIIELKKVEINLSKYEVRDMGSNDIKIPFILDKQTGSVWKWWQSDKGMGFSQMPFQPLPQSYNSDEAAQIELGLVMKLYPDFDNYRAETKKILETSKTKMTIEEAYLKAKAERAGKQ